MKCRGEKDDIEIKSLGSSTKDSSLSLSRILIVLIVFVGGVVLGLTSSSHIDKYFRFQSEQLYTTKYNAYESTIQFFDGNNCTVVMHCKIEDCLSMNSFKQPQNLSHGMTDDELFWRSSLVPEKEEFPFTRVPKVAFLFLTRGTLPLLALWERFFLGQDVNFYSIYVHVIPGHDLIVSNSSVFYGREIPSRHVEWGQVSLVDAEKRLLANALLDFSNERFILLSESCIPVYNFPTVYKYLIESFHSFVQSYDDPSRYGRGRYSRWMLPEISLYQWRKGSQWFELNRTLAIKIISDTKYYDVFKKFCKPSCYPDEHYIPTYLNMFYGELNANRTITYVDWSVLSPHPAMFSAENITKEFIQGIRDNGTFCDYNFEKTSMCYLFARKFDETTLEPLLNISMAVMEY